MDKVILFGAGDKAKEALLYCQKRYEVLCFVDNNTEKQGKFVDLLGERIGIERPDILLREEYKNVKIIITTALHSKEILGQLAEMKQVDMRNVKHFSPMLQESGGQTYYEAMFKERTISTGKLISEISPQIGLRNVTFTLGGSGVLDYLLLRCLVLKFSLKNYLEIGTYIGESLRCVSDLCEHLYSITVPSDHPYSMKNFCAENGIPDYSNRLVTDENVVQFLEDSRLFDYKKIDHPIDLYYVDGDHSYDGVYADTKNIFASKQENAIVVWHDFRQAPGLRTEVIRAVQDAVSKEEFERVFLFDNNMCGMYVPSVYYDEIKKFCSWNKNILYSYELLIKAESLNK